jgi:hypothetical protein
MLVVNLLIHFYLLFTCLGCIGLAVRIKQAGGGIQQMVFPISMSVMCLAAYYLYPISGT